jgi:hypothetical protein
MAASVNNNLLCILNFQRLEVNGIIRIYTACVRKIYIRKK